MSQHRKYLVFRLYGPLASWGGIAVGEDRPSLGHPTKSAVLGLIAAALGIRRDAEEIHQNLAKTYHYGVLVASAGNHLRDYHIALIEKGMTFQTRRDEVMAANWVDLKKPRPTAPMVTRRDYRTDAAYTVAIWAESDAIEVSLETMQHALLAPHFVPYLGRKSCPVSLPFEPQIREAANLREVFSAVSFKADRFLVPLLRYASAPWVYWDGQSDDGGFDTLPVSVWQHDELVSRKRWQYRERKEYAAPVFGSAGRT